MVAAPTSARPPLTKGTTMTSSTLLGRGALAAILVAGCLAAPAAMAQSPDNGSSVKDPARANVYVPPVPDGLSAPQGPASTRTIVHAADAGAGPWAVIGLALGGAALLGGASLALVRRTRRARRAVA